MAGAAAVVALFHFLKQGVPGGFGKNLGSLPFLGVLEFPLPGDFAGKQGDPINHGGLVAARFFRPFDGPAHGRSDQSSPRATASLARRSASFWRSFSALAVQSSQDFPNAVSSPVKRTRVTRLAGTVWGRESLPWGTKRCT